MAKLTDAMMTKVRDLIRRADDRQMSIILADYLTHAARCMMHDNAHDMWSEVCGGVPAETEDQFRAVEIVRDAEAICDGNVAVAYNTAHVLRGLMEGFQDYMRERFNLPAWNPVHECHDLIGDTDGLVPVEEVEGNHHNLSCGFSEPDDSEPPSRGSAFSEDKDVYN